MCDFREVQQLEYVIMKNIQFYSVIFFAWDVHHLAFSYFNHSKLFALSLNM